MLQPTRQPEILEADLAPLMLELANWGIRDCNELTWITPPPAGAVNQAKELLHELDAIEDNKITARGKEMLKLPTHPRIAHMLLSTSSLSPLLKERGVPEGQSEVTLATDIVWMSSLYS